MWCEYVGADFDAVVWRSFWFSILRRWDRRQNLYFLLCFYDVLCLINILDVVDVFGNNVFIS